MAKITSPSRLFLASAITLAIYGCGGQQESGSAAAPLTAADAKQYVKEAEQRIADIYEYAGKAEWIAQTYITDDSQYLAAKANEEFKLLGIELANGAAKFKDLDLDYDTKRKLEQLRLGLTLPAPAGSPELTSELAKIESNLGATYGAGIAADGTQYDLIALSNVLAESEDPDAMLKAWQDWRKVSPQMKEQYQRLV